MAIVYKNRYIPAVLYRRTDEVACSPQSDSYSVYWGGKQYYRGSHTRDRRIKPIQYLLDPTSRGHVFRVISHAPINRIWFRKKWWCGPPINAYVWRRSFQDRSGSPSYGSNPLPVHVADTNALLSVRENLFSLSDTLAEFAETAGMFEDFTKELVRIYKLSRGRMRRRGIRPTDAASANLAMSFGISPLVGNMYDGLLHFKDRMNYDIIRRCVGFDEVSAYSEQDWGPNSTWHTTYSEFQVRTVLYVRVSPQATDRIDFGNPLRWAWELIPFSFVVDWGINVGDTLAALDRIPGVSLAAGTRSIQAFHSSRSGVNSPSDPTVVANVPVQEGQAAYSTYQRTVLSSFPMPNRPQWRPSPSYRKIANASSILAQLKRDLVNDFFRR